MRPACIKVKPGRVELPLPGRKPGVIAVRPWLLVRAFRQCVWLHGLLHLSNLSGTPPRSSQFIRSLSGILLLVWTRLFQPSNSTRANAKTYLSLCSFATQADYLFSLGYGDLFYGSWDWIVPFIVFDTRHQWGGDSPVIANLPNRPPRNRTSPHGFGNHVASLGTLGPSHLLN